MKGLQKIEFNPQVGISLEECIEENKRLVYKSCKPFVRKAKALGIEYDDLFQEGSIGLMKAYNKFNPAEFKNASGEGVSFSTFAVPCIKGQLLRFLRDTSAGPRFPRTSKEVGHQILYQEQQKAGFKNRPIEDLAEFFGVSRYHVKGGLDYINFRTSASLQDVINNGNDEAAISTIEDTIHVEADFTDAIVDDFLNSLDPRLKIIVELRLEDKSQQEIGQELGVGQVQVSRLLKRVKFMLSNWLEEEGQCGYVSI
ncbi:RNA polymerase sigma-F factor [compost metagenome]